MKEKEEKRVKTDSESNEENEGMKKKRFGLIAAIE